MAPQYFEAWFGTTGVSPVLIGMLFVSTLGLVLLRLVRMRSSLSENQRHITHPHGSLRTHQRTIQSLRPQIQDESGRRPALSSVLSNRRNQPKAALPVGDVIELFDDVNRSGELSELLQSFASRIAEAYGLEQVVLRLFNARTRLFEARAFHGCSQEMLSHLSTVDVSQDHWVQMVARARGMGEALWVNSGNSGWPDRFDSTVKSSEEPEEWSVETIGDVGLASRFGDELFVLPLGGAPDSPVGYLCAKPNKEVNLEDEVLFGQLRLLARLVVAEIGRCQMRGTLERRNVEYSIVSEQLQEWQSMRDNFVANVSHELRTPLTSIKAYAETLLRAAENMDATTSAEFVDVILHEADRLNQVFDDLLDVAHMESRGRRIARDRLDIKAMAHATASEYRAHFDERGIDLRFFGPETALWVQGDAEGLQQVIDNILSNAAKFTPEGGSVRIELREELGTAYLCVEDTGIGIPEHELHRVFERFYQVDGTATRNYGGQGLGLALCSDIVEWHHGRVWAERRSEGGTRFIVALPVRGFVVRPGTADQITDANERLQWESFLQLSIHLVSEMIGTRVASIMLVDIESELLRIEAAVGLDAEVVQGATLRLGEGVAGQVWQEDRTILVPDLDADPRFRGLANDVTYSPRSLLSVPLRWNGRVVGVINVNSKFNALPFDKDDGLLLEALAERIVVSLESFEAYRQSYRRLASVESGVRALLDIGRERSGRIRELLSRAGIETGRLMGFDDVHLRSLAYALRTYDLGLTEVGRHILRKENPLSEEERAHLDTHARVGAELVAELEPSTRVRRMILHHHENFDGTGYPEGLAGEAIPVGARIVRLVDTLAALLSDRPFREALPLADAINVLESESGTTYCPRVTPVFLHVLEAVNESLVEVLKPVEREAPEELVLAGAPEESV